METAERLFDLSRKAAGKLADTDKDRIALALKKVADALEENSGKIIAANRLDLEKMDEDNPLYDRLRLDGTRVSNMAADIRKVADLPAPYGKTLASWIQKDGLEIRKVSVPFGVVGIIYEARPNVTSDVFSLCMKSGNSCILKGGSDAENSNAAIVGTIRETLERNGLDPDCIILFPSVREAVLDLLKAEHKVDLIIPRGGRSLIEFVRKNSSVPVIETGAGVCHTYFDKYGDLEKGERIITNAKTRRVSVCNALDCLVIHKDRLDDLPSLCRGVAGKNVTIYADSSAYAALEGRYPGKLLGHADEESFGTEFLSYKMAVRTVENITEALEHISKYSSGHSECIVSENEESIALFMNKTDAACVYANASTAFTDGGQFGFGAEIGISTQKLHARGPMGLAELNTYKYTVYGKGQTRE